MQKGEEIVLCDSEETCYAARIDAIGASRVVCERLYRVKTAKHPLDITLGMALVRRVPFEWTLEKAVELGARAFIPVECARNVVRLDKKAEKKHERFNRIAKEAAEQCHRDDVMTVHRARALDEIDAEAYDHVLFAYEEESEATLKHILSPIEKRARILVLIGPEGGFTEEEAAMLVSKGAQPFSLGPRILRSETAAVYSLSAMSYESELNHS